MTKARITCMEHGCLNAIWYDTETDEEVPLYCDRHRTEDGRHSEVRILNKKPDNPESIPEKTVILRCSSRACGNRTTIPMRQFQSGDVPTCGKCGRKMVYHKDGDDHV